MRLNYQTPAETYFTSCAGDPVKVRQHIDDLCDVAAACIRSKTMDEAIANIGIAVELAKMLQTFDQEIDVLHVVRRLAVKIERAAATANY